jgi:glycosyltransferase involved in cell wall biosynthesis
MIVPIPCAPETRRFGLFGPLGRALTKGRSFLSSQKERRRFWARQSRSIVKRVREIGCLGERMFVGLRCTARARGLHEAARLIRHSGLLDAAWYRRTYPEARLGKPDPVLHYLRTGAALGYNPNPFFDTRWYVAQSQDHCAGVNPLVHFITRGGPEGLDPSPRFSARYYLSQRADARGSSLSPLAHYLRYGMAEGVRPAPDAGFQPTDRYADPSSPFEPAVTVVVPNYNHAPYLRKRLDSIYSQTYRNLKVLLLDDCSTDGSRSILREYAARHPENTTFLAGTRNGGSVFLQWKKGIEAADTELVWIAESDDFCDPNFLEALVPFFRDESVQLAYCNTIFCTEDGTPSRFNFDSYVGEIDPAKWRNGYVETAHREVARGLGIRNTIPNVSSAVFRRPVHLPLLNDPKWLEMRVCGDWLFYLHLLRGGKIAFSRETRSYHRYHSSNTSVRTRRLPIYYEEHETVCRHVVNLYAVEGDVIERNRRFVEAEWDHVFRGEKPGWEVTKAYDPAQIRAEAPRRLPNVLVVCHDFMTGGGEVFPIRLAVALKERGFGVTFFDFNGYEANDDFRGMLPQDIPVLQKNAGLWDVNKIVEDFGIEIVHTHHGAADLYFADHLRRGPGRLPRHVVTTHGMYETMPPSTFERYATRLIRAVDHWILVAEKNAEPFRARGLLKESTFSKIGNGMERPKPIPVEREELGIPADAFVVCTISRAIEEKGWREAVEAVDRSRRATGRDIRLVLVGEGPLNEAMRSRPIPYVHAVGFKKNPVDFYAMADLGLLPTKFRSESCPLTLIECLIAGRPMVASDIGEIRGMLTTGNGSLAGAVFSLTDWQLPIDSIAEAISFFATDSEAYRQAACRAREAAQKFDMGEVVDRYREVYLRVLSEKGLGPGAPEASGLLQTHLRSPGRVQEA